MPTLIVETGQIVPGANSYVSLDEAKTYHANIGNKGWASGDAVKLSQALLMATRSLELLYGPKYLGSINPYSAQELLFPRRAFVDNSGRAVSETKIPLCLKNAQCEIAQLYLDGIDIMPVDERDTAVKVKKVSVDVISEETQYYSPVASESFANFETVKRILSPILQSNRGNWVLRA